MVKESLFLDKAIAKFVDDKIGYYSQWIYDKPIVVSTSRYEKVERLQQLMHRIILHFVNNFEDYQHLMVLSDRVKEIVRSLSGIPYKVGTYRTDFVFDKERKPKLIEITCRFALNTIFVNSIFNRASEDRSNNFFSKDEVLKPYQELYSYLETSMKGDIIYVLKGLDKKNESFFFKGILEDAGKEVVEVQYTEIKSLLPSISKEALIISELKLEEIELLSQQTILELAQHNFINDFRTALLIHDKQFFSVLCNAEIQKACFTEDEIRFFNQFLIPTYNASESKESWEDAKKHKEHWILKHRTLGKSESVYAGVVMSQKDWEALFENENMNDFILQSWVSQPRFKGTIKGESYTDFVTGTYMFFNDNCFGYGPFRSSSHPITNVIDDRKISAVILAKDKELASDFIFLD